MNPDPPELSSTLVEWANLVQAGNKIKSLRDLQDGHILWAILKEMERDYFSGALPENHAATADNWIPRWQNLKYLTRAAVTYLRDECAVLPNYVKKLDLDLKLIAQDGAKHETLQVLKIVFLAAFYTAAQRQRNLEILQQLSDGNPIAHFISAVNKIDEDAGDAQTEAGSDVDGLASPRRGGTPLPQPAVYSRDPELEREERLLRAEANVKDLQRENNHLVSQIEDAHSRHRELEDEMTEIRYRLEQGGGLDASNGILEQFQNKSDQDKDYISQLEQELESTRESAEVAERQMQKLKTDSTALQNVRDELQMIRLERDDLLQKMKANENLKKKIITLQDAEKQVDAIKKDNELLQEQLRTLDAYKKRAATLAKVNDEAVKAFQNSEQQIFDMGQHRKRLENEVKLLHQRYEQSKERHNRDAEEITSLQEKVRELELDGGGKSLDDLGDADASESSSKDKLLAEMSARVAKLEEEYVALQDSSQAPPDGAATEALRKQLDQARERCQKLETQYIDEYRDKLGIEAFLKDEHMKVMQDSESYVHMRVRLSAEAKSRETSERKVNELETQIAELKATLKEKETKLAIVDQSKAAAAEELRQSVGFESETLTDENKRLLSYAKMVEEDADESKALLRHALLNACALLQEPPDDRTKHETKLIIEQLESAIRDPNTLEKVARHIASRIEDVYAAVKDDQAKATETQVRLEENVMELERKLRKAEEESKKGTATPLQGNLQRELNLITSAWYDMNNRMQSDSVVLQRRVEAPRSFLSRQRKLVSTPSIPRRR